ncbi:MAG TPA: GYD domain-containing protein [Stellaceae bacterium]|jgi:uncharacterized protein with GYD domain|nr:GYD domain-containing protein [Stellaceae bacterium]
MTGDPLFCYDPIDVRDNCGASQGGSVMAIYMWQGAYTSEAWAAQLKNPQNRIETAARPACEAAGGRLIGGWYSFGEYDVVIVADVPNNQSMSAVAMAVGSGGHLKASKTTVLMTGTEGVEAMRQAGSVAAAFTPAR